jgi:hypothetical protein
MITKLYTVTTIESRERLSHSSVKAVCTSVEEAKRIIETNEFDIHELTDNCAVIAEISANIAYGIPHDDFFEVWYEWQGTSHEGRYIPCDKPKEFERIAFGL